MNLQHLQVMDRRTFEGPMDWEYQSQPPVDHTSPFAKLGQKPCKSLLRCANIALVRLYNPPGRAGLTSPYELSCLRITFQIQKRRKPVRDSRGSTADAVQTTKSTEAPTRVILQPSTTK